MPISNYKTQKQNLLQNFGKILNLTNLRYDDVIFLKLHS